MKFAAGDSVSGHAWQWPSVGAAPVNYGLDSEIFDTERFPHIQTFVREAIQNSLDARQDKCKPVRVRFRFHKSGDGAWPKFLADLEAKKAACGLRWPEEWDEGEADWLTVEDSNTSGLNGSLTKRTSDFWNYWLNFGISNKDGMGRGGRGIGRITFLLASRIATVIGVTRRTEDGRTVACGMSVLKPTEQGDDFKCSYAYLAKAEAVPIFDLYDEPEFHADISKSFGISDYGDGSTGLSLIVPYPHDSLTPEGIVAAAVEHFGPAIINQSLVVEVNGTPIDHDTIDAEAAQVMAHFKSPALAEKPSRVLGLLRHSTAAPDFRIEVTSVSDRLCSAVDEVRHAEIRSKFEAEGKLALAVAVPVIRKGVETRCDLHVAIARTPQGRTPADFFFREGMCLPGVTARNPADVDVIVQANEGELVAYLNFCEGKAHLDLLETSEVRAKLKEVGFDGGVALKRFVKLLMSDLRALVLPDASKPDASTFSNFFSAPRPAGHQAQKRKGKKSVIIGDPPEPKVRVFLIDTLADGFRIRANPEYSSWPVNLRAEIAYADGTRRPAWSRHDFQLAKLEIDHAGSEAPAFKDNILRCRECSVDFSIEVKGFDTRRELVTNVRAVRDA